MYDKIQNSDRGTKVGIFGKNLLPPNSQRQKREVAQETNYIANFLANGDDYYQIVYDRGSVTTLKDFERAFKNHMRIHHTEVKAALNKNNFFPFKAAGFVNEVKNLCKACKFPHKKACCEGDVAGDRGRFKRVVLIHMRIQDLKCVPL